MMIMGDRKKAVTAILGPKKEIEAEDSIDPSESLKVLSREALDAIKSNDEQAFLDAIRALFMELDSDDQENEI